MGRKRIEICILTVLLAAVAMIFFVLENEGTRPVSFLAVSDGGTEEIHVWEKAEGEFYVFLPSYGDLSLLRLKTAGYKSFWFDDVKLRYGMTCENLEKDRSYTLSDGSAPIGTIIFLQSNNLPSVHIDTGSGTMEHIHESKQHEESGRIRLYTAEGTLAFSGNLNSIKARGNSTFDYQEKKAYNIRLNNAVSLLEMGAAEKWVLLANAYDATNLKNKLVFDFADQVGLKFSPDSRFVDLYLNGEYRGLYLLSEKNEVHPQRVDIGQEGSFLVSVERERRLKAQNIPYFKTQLGAPVRLRYNTMEQRQLEEIWQSIERALCDQDGKDPKTGKHWTELIDLDSWVRKYLIQEVFEDIDGAITSQFYYLDGNDSSGKVYAGPVWDYDDAMGGADWMEIEQIPEIFYAHRPYDYLWFHKLFYNDIFHSRMKKLYQQDFSPLLAVLAEEKLPEYAREILTSAQMNRIRWNMDDPAQRIGQMQAHLKERTAFLNSIWIEHREYIEVMVDLRKSESDWLYIDYVLSPGDCLPELPDMSPYRWYLAGTDQPVDPTQPFYQETGICLKKEFSE